MHMSTEDTARPTQAATANPTSTNGEEEPLLSAQPAPTVVTNNDGRTWIDTNPLSRWIVSQWEETYEFEALCVETTRNALGIPSYSWRGLPLLYAAMIVGIAIAVVVDGLTYKDDNDDDDDDSDRKSKSWQRHPSSTDLSDMIHQYTWYHVLVAVLVFNACYSLAAYRANLNGWRLFLQRCKEVCIVVAQVLFFLNIFGTVHVSWMWVAAPVIVWTLLLVLRLQWQALVGLTAILAAFKLSSAAADAQWTWTMVFTPIWVLLVCIASLVRAGDSTLHHGKSSGCFCARKVRTSFEATGSRKCLHSSLSPCHGSSKCKSSLKSTATRLRLRTRRRAAPGKTWSL
ncbi:hypothetical protein, variant 3 [Aphanomyces invadans]|uniref:Transmembrane protein n=1 Tax=Aphanomyces invadans TaxID=157072 RepID=A0A024UCH7_9STRA|nr:hypothetical protein, variant 2 [Aphanomyces invadans]XP_008866905.1 hypothetical protein, variant 3 [Aphanomyces invadans]ETW03948.1 hypothetical protein, variant 2 [Aphanomyces invadans]ETW03949.1 hypothetical protein, variant 3 [Aphanomyces invadans]|eukprot:XP_008866904.1 hypothetical protein, variant 2 [Aphanomyces invadans]